jgi:hypothetical protein
MELVIYESLFEVVWWRMNKTEAGLISGCVSRTELRRVNT